MIRPRLRTDRQRAYWDGLTPAERAAFLVGQQVGSGGGVPEPRLVLHLRRQLGDELVVACERCALLFVRAADRPTTKRCETCRTPPPMERECISCGATFTRPPHRGHPPTHCPTCRGIAA